MMVDSLNGTKNYSYDGVGNIKSITDELNRTTTFNYDALNRTVRTTDPLSQVKSTVYDGVDNVLSVTDALGQVATYGYDALDRQIKVTDTKGQVTTNAYDAVGNVTAIVDSVGNKTGYAFDVNNRLISMTDALGKVSSYQYDLADNRIATTDRNGRVRKFSYDKLNRQIGEQWLDASGKSAHNIDYVFDGVGNIISTSDTDSKYAYAYDALNRSTSADNKGTAGVPNVLLNYGYDAVGNVLKVTDTIGGQLKGTTNYAYDALDRVVSLNQSGNGVATKRVDMSYDAASQMTGVSRFADLAGLSGIVSSLYTYDAYGKTTGLVHKRGSNNVASYGYVYDPLNRVTQATSVDGTSAYTYDPIGQVTNVDHSYQADEAYSYDSNGNRTNAGYSTGVNNHLSSDGTYSYEYDGEGNRTKRTEVATGKVSEYIWDYRNRLTKVSFKDAAGVEIKTVIYTYDVNNRRITKSIDPDGVGATAAVVERYVYDGQNIILSFDGNGTQTHRYLHGVGVDQILADENGQGKTLWTLADTQGTVRDLVDESGVVLNHITYDSFGKITNQTNAAVSTIFGYTGREYDAETGQYYYRARYYDQNVGRFISEDPLGFAAGDTNIYRYVGNSPTNYRDPLGLECDCSSGINYGTVAKSGLTSAVTGLAIAAAIGFAGLTAPVLIGVGAVFLVASAGASLYRRSEQAQASGNSNFGEIAGAAALDTFGFGGLVEGIRGSELVTGRCLSSEERSKGIGEGIGNGIALAGGAKAFKFGSELRKPNIPQGVIDVAQASKTECFVAGTQIQTIDGTKNIEDIHVGDWVLSDDPNTVGDIEYKQVLQTFAKTTTTTIDIYIDGEKITTTEEHPFWVPGVGWVAAKDLNVGTHLQTKNESWLDIDKIESHTLPTSVYNFEVEGFHTYFVSNLNLLVHNSCNVPEYIYRTMSEKEFAKVELNQGLSIRPSGSSELGITREISYLNNLSERKSIASQYGIKVEFEVNEGTFQQLIDMGATHNSARTSYPDLPFFERGMTVPQVKFEQGQTLSILLGKSPEGVALFNQNIINIRRF
jgi:RHS repeat-associated protein